MKCKITLKDEVNCKVEGLDIDTRRKCEKELKFFLPYAYHVPAFKLGRWDGCQSYFTIGGITYTNLLDKVLPIIMGQGYEIDLNDLRFKYDQFGSVDETPTNTKYGRGLVVAGEPNIKRLPSRDY